MSYEADFIVGGYVIQPNTTETFYFWFPNGKANEYFDVSIMPTGVLQSDEDAIPPASLVEVRREMACGTDGLFVIRVTLQNEMAGAVEFMANHIRIPSH